MTTRSISAPPVTIAVPAKPARAVAVSTVTQLGARVFHLLLNVVTSVILVRYLGPDHYGDYVRVIAVTGWLGLLSEFGLNKVGVRQAARDTDAGSVVGTVMGTRLVLSVAATGLGQLMLLPLHSSATVHWAALVASLMFVCDALFATIVVFQVTLRQHYEAFIRVGMEVIELGVLVALVTHGAGLVALVSAPVVAASAGCAVGYAVARHRFGLRLAFDRELAATLLRTAAPIVPAIMIGVLTLKLDSLMVAALRPQHEVGLYGAAYQPIEYAFNAVTVVALPFFPMLARSHGRDRAEFVQAYTNGTEALLAFILPITAVTVVVAGPMVRAVYNTQWDGSAAPLRLLSIALVLMTLSAWNGFVLLSADRQTMTIRYGVAALVVSLVVCSVLLPTIGYVGGAVAAITANVVSAAWSLSLLHRRVHVSLSPRRVARVVAANAGLAAIAAVLRAVGLPWWLAAGAGLATYPLLLSSLRVLSLRYVLSLLRDKSAASPIGGVA